MTYPWSLYLDERMSVHQDNQKEDWKYDMDEHTFQRKMAELIDRIKELPGKPDTEAASTDESQKNGLKTSIGELQESLDYLRLSVKYLVFDLEATRRENAYLRRLVEQANRERNGRAESDQEPENGFE
jgi:hypothetical protein